MGKKIIFTGANGMVGSYIDQVQWHTDIIKTTRADFDITKLNQVEAYFTRMQGQVEAIVHLAAETDVDKCEKEYDLAYLANTIGTQNMVYQALRYDIPMLYVSTLGVFGGDNQMGPFHEFSKPCPPNNYAWTKLYGEEIVQHHLSKYFIVRAGWMMGGVERDKKFIMKVIKQILEGKNEIFGLEDTIGSPTYAKELIETISKLIKTEWWGIYHSTNNGIMSRYEMAKIVCAEIAPEVKVIRVRGDFFKLPARRPLSEVSENRMLTMRGLNQMSTAEDAIVAYIGEIKKSGLLDAVITP